MSDVCCLKEKSWRLGRRVQVIKGLGGWLGLDSNSRCSVASALWQGPLPKFGCTPAHKRTLDSAKPKTEHTSGTYRDGREGVHEFMWGSFEQAARHRTDGDESTDPRSNLASYIRASGRHHVGFPFWLIAVSEHPSASRAAELSDGPPRGNPHLRRLRSQSIHLLRPRPFLLRTAPIFPSQPWRRGGTRCATSRFVCVSQLQPGYSLCCPPN